MQILIFIPFAISIMREQTQTSVAGRKSALLLDFGTFPRIYSSLHRCGSKSFFSTLRKLLSLHPTVEGLIFLKRMFRRRAHHRGKILLIFSCLFFSYSFSLFLSLSLDSVRLLLKKVSFALRRVKKKDYLLTRYCRNV